MESRVWPWNGYLFYIFRQQWVWCTANCTGTISNGHGCSRYVQQVIRIRLRSISLADLFIRSFPHILPLPFIFSMPSKILIQTKNAELIIFSKSIYMQIACLYSSLFLVRWLSLGPQSWTASMIACHQRGNYDLIMIILFFYVFQFKGFASPLCLQKRKIITLKQHMYI